MQDCSNLSVLAMELLQSCIKPSICQIHPSGQWDNMYIHSQALTHWGRVTHICVSTLTIIGSDTGLSPGRRQAIIWTNDGLLLIGPLGTNFSEISIEILTFSFRKMRLKVSSAKWRSFCLGLNVLMGCCSYIVGGHKSSWNYIEIDLYSIDTNGWVSARKT